MHLFQQPGGNVVGGLGERVPWKCSEHFSHDRINRLTRTAKLTPCELRQRVRRELVLLQNGCILFDDWVLDKRHSFAIELVRRQWSGKEKKVIKGIVLVTCVYVNPDTQPILGD